jgi:prepilin-type N-terminal cleavage/methylation domain-containing protein
MQRRRTSEVGFTLVELMAVVVITGILAVIAVYSVRKYVASSKTSEATEMIGSIKAAEESYKDETFAYLPVSTDFSKAQAYPTNFKPGPQKAQWGGAGPGSTGWQQLGVTTSNPVVFAYACVVGAANSTVTAPSSDSGNITISGFPSTLGTPWYVVKAYSDLSGSNDPSQYTVFVGTSFSGDIFSANN